MGSYGVPTDEIAILKVEAVELVAGLLRIHYILVDDEGGALGVARNALADLTAKTQSVGEDGGGGEERTYRTGPNLPKRSKSSSAETLKLRAGLAAAGRRRWGRD